MGYVEVVEVIYDLSKMSFEMFVKVFFEMYDFFVDWWVKGG